MPEILVEKVPQNIPREFIMYRVCARCHGSGELGGGIHPVTVCPGCGGDGEITAGRIVAVSEE